MSRKTDIATMVFKKTFK
jgi:Pyruvate/2-oxoacid:ferredoxin oxidoreductase delta subunit